MFQERQGYYNEIRKIKKENFEIIGKENINRRKMLEVLMMVSAPIGALATVGQCSGGTQLILDQLKNSNTKRQQSIATISSIRDIFFRGLGSDFLFHPGIVKYDKVANPDDDKAAMHAICSLFEFNVNPIVHDYSAQHGMESGLICIGSPATNRLSQMCFEYNDEYILKAPDGAMFELQYVHYTDVAQRTVRRLLDGRDLLEPNYQIRDLNKRLPYECLLSGDRPLDAYLLFSKLPHPRVRDRAVAVWAGNIGPGTEAARLILGENGISADEVNRLEEVASANDFFQALFKINTIELDKSLGRDIPMSCKLVDVRPLRKFG